MKLINYENYAVTISDEALLVRPIRKIFNSDKTKTKERFMQAMSIIFFLKDPRSSYLYINDEKERLAAIIQQEGLPSNFKIDGDLKDAIDQYEKMIETPSSMLLKSTLTAIDKVREFFEDVDLKEVDEKGKPIYQVSTIVTAMKQVPSLAKDIIETQKLVEHEIKESGRARGGNESMKLFENGVEL